MKNQIGTIGLLSLIGLSAAAQSWSGERHEDPSLCSAEHRQLNGGRCITAGAGAAVATGSGIYSARSYSNAREIERQGTIAAFSTRRPEDQTDARQIRRTTQTFTDGDRITMQYQLNEAENRAYHIDLMESNASSARSSALMYRTMAAQARTGRYETRTEFETEYYTDHEGKLQSRQVSKQVQVWVPPDYARALVLDTLAADQDRLAADYAGKASAARHGGPVPTYTLDKVFDAETGTARTTGDFVDSHIAGGGKILKIDRLPVEKFRAFRAAVRGGRAGIVGVALGAGVAVEEAVSGLIAEKITGNADRYSPTMRRPGQR